MTTEAFQRTEMLFGSKAFNKIRQAKIAVIGCGAVGGFAIESLARIGIGTLILADGDTVEKSNINRQLCATQSTLGQQKTLVFKKRISDISPDTQVITKNCFITKNNFTEIANEKPDFVIDAIDILPDKADLIINLKKSGIPFISSMGAALKTNPALIKTATLNQTSVCPLAAKLRKMLKNQEYPLDFPCVFSTEKPAPANGPHRQMGSLITITGQFGLIMANQAVLSVIKE